MMESGPKPVIDEKIRQYISYDESLYDLMCSLIGFEFATENKTFNSYILNDGLAQGNSIELTYTSNNEKNPFLYFLLTEILYANHLNQIEAGPVIEVLLFDNYTNINLFLLHTFLGNKFHNIENQNEREETIKGLLKKLFIFKPNTKKDFLLNLKSVGTLVDKHKFLRVVIIDSINSFQFFEDSYKRDNFDVSNKDKKRQSMNAKRNFNKEINSRIQENIKKIVAHPKLCTILFKREYFKMSDCFTWEEEKMKFTFNLRLTNHLVNKVYPSRKICLLNFENISDAAMDIMNKMARNDKNKMMIERQPNLNLAIIKQDGEDNILFVTYHFTDINFQVLNCFEVQSGDYIMMTKSEAYPDGGNRFHAPA